MRERQRKVAFGRGAACATGPGDRDDLCVWRYPVARLQRRWCGLQQPGTSHRWRHCKSSVDVGRAAATRAAPRWRRRPSRLGRGRGRTGGCRLLRRTRRSGYRRDMERADERTSTDTSQP